MKTHTLKRYMLALGLAIVMSVPLESCKTQSTAHGWTDLAHAKQLDKKKGKRLKKLQKNVAHVKQN